MFSYDFKKLTFKTPKLSYESLYPIRFGTYADLFVAHRRDVFPQAFSYLTGLLRCEHGKRNMERIEEVMGDIEYHCYYQFISNSPWDHRAVIGRVRGDVNGIMRTERDKHEHPSGLIVDESAHLKRGNKSVGVARQYAGVVGKVENCQVGVYISLCSGNRSCLIDERLYLPEDWISDPKRCEKAGIPKENQVFQTKPQLALEMIDGVISEGIEFDWVGGDGLYGHTYELAKGLDERQLLFVLDVHKNQHVFLTEPTIAVPQRQGDQGRTPTRLKADELSIRVDQYAAGLSKSEWKKIRIRRTAKGWLKAWIHVKEVWVWDGEEKKARKRTLVIRQDISHQGQKVEINYSLSNGSIADYTIQEFAYFQAQRYWVERDFQNGKGELGMSDYQVRKWLGWHHHHAIVFMAMLFMLEERIYHESEYPLMSVRDARILITTLIARNILTNEPDMFRQLRLMEKRHRKRQFDIDRHFKPDT